jgi:hypothetical protein
LQKEIQSCGTYDMAVFKTHALAPNYDFLMAEIIKTALQVYIDKKIS